MEHPTQRESASSGVRTGAGQGTANRRSCRHAGKTDRTRRQSRSGRQQPEAGGFPFPFTGRSEPANRARSAYDHAERGPQRTSGHL